MAKKIANDPQKTKTGKTRLGPLNISQLEDMLSKSSRPKEQAKIRNRVRILKSRRNYTAPAVVETAAE